MSSGAHGAQVVNADQAIITGNMDEEAHQEVWRQSLHAQPSQRGGQLHRADTALTISESETENVK